VILNMSDAAVDVPLPLLASRSWYPAVDTFERATSGVFLKENQRPVLATMWQAQPRSVIIFEGR
jgi:hypothetical protein